MKEQDFKKQLKINFEQKAPAAFTANVMQNINAAKTSYEPILSRTSSIVSVILFVALFILVASLNQPFSLNFDFSIITKVIISNANLLMLPFSVVLLMFLKEWFYYRIASNN